MQGESVPQRAKLLNRPTTKPSGKKYADCPIWVWVKIYILGGYSLVLKSEISLSLIFFS